jgi:hypothetical protein
MATQSSMTAAGRPRYPAGQRLTCSSCGSEIEIIGPCTCDPPDQVFRCCGRDMEATPGRDIHINVE